MLKLSARLSPCHAPPIITKRMMEMLRRVKAVFSLVDSFIPKQRMTENMLVIFHPFCVCTVCVFT